MSIYFGTFFSGLRGLIKPQKCIQVPEPGLSENTPNIIPCPPKLLSQRKKKSRYFVEFSLTFEQKGDAFVKPSDTRGSRFSFFTYTWALRSCLRNTTFLRTNLQGSWRTSKDVNWKKNHFTCLQTLSTGNIFQLVGRVSTISPSWKGILKLFLMQKAFKLKICKSKGENTAWQIL